MAADIDFTDIVGASTLLDGGYAGKLMELARAHVDDAVKYQRLTKSEAGLVYTAMIPAAIQGAISFVMDEKITEAKIDGIVSDNETKAEQVLLTRLQVEELKLKIEVEYGVIVSVDALDEITTVDDPAIKGLLERSMKFQEINGIGKR